MRRGLCSLPGSGPDADRLLVTQHRYFPSGYGSYDEEQLFTFDGVAVEPVPAPPALATYTSQEFAVRMPSGPEWKMEEHHLDPAPEFSGFNDFYEVKAARGESIVEASIGFHAIEGEGERQTSSAAEFLARYAPPFVGTDEELERGEEDGGRVAWSLWAGYGGYDSEGRFLLFAEFRSPRDVAVVKVMCSDDDYVRLGGFELARAILASLRGQSCRRCRAGP